MNDDDFLFGLDDLERLKRGEQPDGWLDAQKVVLIERLRAQSAGLKKLLASADPALAARSTSRCEAYDQAVGDSQTARTKGSSEAVICGEVAGRNGYGGMGESSPFIYRIGRPVFLEPLPSGRFIYDICAGYPMVLGGGELE